MCWTVPSALAAVLFAPAGLVAAGWRSVTEPREFIFPRDHAAHEDYRIEWWYYTGNLVADDGRRFGYQLTFFRTGLDFAPANPSRFAVRDLYVAHFAVSEIDAGRFRFFERVNRRGVGWAGADADRYRVWNGDWKARLEGNDHVLFAQEGPAALDLRLTPKKPPVLHGDRGMSRKGPTRGNASYYYSFTRMETRGTLTLDGHILTVTGSSWMDHEFSSSFLEPGQRGWDWFALQLDDGREMMLYQIRRGDGTVDPQSSATLVHADGRWEPLSPAAFSLVPGATWKSPQSGAEYPIAWMLRLPGQGLDLTEIRAAFPGQEMNTMSSTGFPYWEGSVRVRGTSGGRPITGQGYLEMTGYREGLGSALRTAEGP